MSLANPLGLVALLSLPAILALHLLRERRSKRQVSSLALWKFLEQEVRGSKFQQIPLTWLLVLDLSIALLLSLAMARPTLEMVLPVRNARHILILMDVSTSMRSTDVSPDRFSSARLDAMTLINEAGSRDVVTVLAFGGSARWVADSRQDGLDELAARLGALQAGETGEQLEIAIGQGLAAVQADLPAEFHIFTDTAYELPDVDPFPHPLYWHVYGNGSGNQAVIAIASRRLKNNQIQVFTRLANFDDSDIIRVLSLQADGAPVDSISLELPANSEVSQVWNLTGEPLAVTVALMGGDTLSQDDRATIGIQRRDELDVLLVYQAPEEQDESTVDASPVERALASIPAVHLRKIAPEEYSPGVLADLVVFQNYIPQEWPGCPSFVLQPPAELPASSAFAFRGRAGIPPDAQALVLENDSILQGVDFGGVRWQSAFNPERTPDGFLPLVSAAQYPLLLRGQVDGQKVLFLLADIEQSNLTRHPAFPLLVVNLVESIRTPQTMTLAQTGAALSLPSSDGQQSLKITSPLGQETSYSGEWPSAWLDTLEPGPYRLELQDLQGQYHSFVVGVNAGDSSESDIRPSQPGSAAPEEQALREERLQRSVDLMPWLLGAVLLLLVWEAALAWR